MTEDRKGNKPTLAVSVEMEDALNAEHCVEPFNDMQACAREVGRLVRSSVLAMADAVRGADLRRRGRMRGVRLERSVCVVLSNKGFVLSHAPPNAASPSSCPPRALPDIFPRGTALRSGTAIQVGSGVKVFGQ